MCIGQKNDSLIDLAGDINAQLCTLVKLTKPETVYLAIVIRTLYCRCKVVANPRLSQ